jgi:3-oxoacyl-[acyl-carrier protein] reductase
MDLGLGGRVVLVTGGSAGIGLATAESFVAEGALVAICSRDASKLESASKKLAAGKASSDNVLAVPADLSQPEAASRVANHVMARWGHIDVLVNNVGGPPPGSFDSTPDAAWHTAVDLTLMSAIRMARAVLEPMRRRRWGRIVNISSYSVKEPIDGLLLSNSIRLAVLGWAKTLANEVASDNVLVNTICPGWTRTDRVRDVLGARATRESADAAQLEGEIARTIPLGRLAEPRDRPGLSMRAG